jgi:uncharacterized protein (DUF983 family)
MFGKGSKLYSIFRLKCPHCHEGEFFVSRNPYDLARVGDLLERCPVCDRKYSPEPGFFFGAMYVSYALGVAMFVTVYIATAVLYPSAPMWLYITLILGSLFLFGPVLYVLSKSIWANLFFSYKGVALTEKEKQYRAERMR